MKDLNNYIQEKYLLDQDYKEEVVEKISDDLYKYRGIKIIADHQTINQFNRYSRTTLEKAFDILVIIIDKFYDDLKDCIFKLFYSGYSGFTLYYKQLSEKYIIGYIMHNVHPGHYDSKGENWQFDRSSLYDSYNNELGNKIKDFMQPYYKSFKEI